MRLIPVGRHCATTSGIVIPLVQAQVRRGVLGVFRARHYDTGQGLRQPHAYPLSGAGQAEPSGWGLRRSRIVLHPQPQQPQLPPQTDPPPELPRRPPPHQQQQTARQQQPHQQTPQPRRRRYHSLIQGKILLAITKILLRLHPLAILRHCRLGISQRSRRIPRFLMPTTPVHYQVHRHHTIGAITYPRQKHLAAGRQGMLPRQPPIAIGGLDADIALEPHHIVHRSARSSGRTVLGRCRRRPIKASPSRFCDGFSSAEVVAQGSPRLR